MTTEIHLKDLHLEADTGLVTMLDFGSRAFGLHTLEGRLSLYVPFSITWPEGSRQIFDPTSTADRPIAHRLLDSLLGTHIVHAVAGIERADLRVEFDNGTEFEFSAAGNAPQNWYAENPDGVQFVGRASGELQWWGGYDENMESEEPQELQEPVPNKASRPTEAREQPAADGDEPRVIDLEITEHIYGITVYGTSIHLETHCGSIYLAGPFTVTDADGEEFGFDPTNLADDTVAGALIAVLIDHQVEAYVLRPGTSEFSVTLTGGGGLTWKASTPAQAQFSAKLRNGREFWSKGDGTIYWYGGPEGTHPKFLVGGPKPTD